MQRVKAGGRSYWRIVESRRVNGKPRPVPIKYLGTADALLDRLLREESGKLRIQSFRHGDVAALKAAADRLQVVKIIDGQIDTPGRSVSVGKTLLLAAFNRAIQPRSKRGWAAWAGETSLSRLFPSLKLEQFSSQFFWDQMDRVSVAALEKIEEQLTVRIVETLGLKLDTLLYDTTNFFTYIASTNTRSELAKRGHSKQKRADLKLFSLALLVARDSQVPICSQVYEGNRVDSKVFPEALTKIRQRLERLQVEVEDVTLVYDRGNNSKANQDLIDNSSLGYVAALTPSHHADLLEIPLSRYGKIEHGPLAEIRALRLRREIWGAERTVVLFLSEQLRAGQRRGLEQILVKRVGQLKEWSERLAKPQSGPRSAKTAQKQIDALLSGQFVKRVLHVSYHPKRKGSNRLEYWIDEKARQHLEQEVFGKRILITNRHDWSEAQILGAYRGQSEVEECFRQLKDDEHLAVRPQFHWTDHKIRVHTFICLLALLLSRLVESEARQAGWKGSLSGLLEQLGRVRLALVLRPSGEKRGRPRCDWQLEETALKSVELFKQLVPAKAPFVYTTPSS